MPRRPEIGNIQLYPDRPLNASDRNGYVLKFYCPIKGKRIRRNCGTRDKRDARRILRECRERLLNGEYVASGGAITAVQASTRQKVQTVLQHEAPPSGMSWDDCYDRYRKHYQARSREKSTTDALSRLSISERILRADRNENGLPDDGPIAEYLNLDSLEYLQERLLEGDESKYDSRSPMTVNSTVGAVMTFARFCFRHGWIDKVPPLTKLSVDEVMKGRPISEKEFSEMIDATPAVVGERGAASWQFLLRVIWESGFRIGDCLDFSWDDERHIHPIWPTRPGEHPTLNVPSSQKNRKAQEVPMLPGLQTLLDDIPSEQRSGWVVQLVPPARGEDSNTFRPTPDELARLTENYTNSAIGRALDVSEAAVRKWIKQSGLQTGSNVGQTGLDIPPQEVAALKAKAYEQATSVKPKESKRPSKDWVGRMISRIGTEAGIVVRQEDADQGKRIKYASAHDIRRGCAQRLINAGVTAETLKLVMRHKDFATTERYYGATRQVQSAAGEIQEKLSGLQVNSIHGETETTAIEKISTQELMKLKTLIEAL